MKIIDVPDVPRPAGSDWCWHQQTDPTKPHMFERCTFTQGHAGPHQWAVKKVPQ